MYTTEVRMKMIVIDSVAWSRGCVTSRLCNKNGKKSFGGFRSIWMMMLLQIAKLFVT